MGTGRWGKNLVRVLTTLKQAMLSWIVDPDEQNLAAAHSLAPSARPVTHIKDTRFDFDAAVIATPAHKHEQHLLELTALGKHVFVEKPAGLNAPNITRICAKNTQNRRVLMVGHQLRYHPGFEAVCAMIKAGRIGRVKRIEATRSALLDLQKEPGVLWSLGPHDIAMIIGILNQLPQHVRCRFSPRNEPFNAVSARISLGFSGEVEASVTLESSPNRIRFFRVHGERGRVDFDDSQAFGNVTVHPISGAPYPLEYPQIEPLKQEMKQFVSCIRHGGSPLTGPEHIETVTEILAECHRAGLTPPF